MKPYKTDYCYTRVKYVPLPEPGPNTDLRVIRRDRPHRQPFSPSKVPRKTNQTNLTPGQFAFILRQIHPQKLRVKTKQNPRASRIQITANRTKGANTRTARGQSVNEQRQTFIQS